MSYQVRIVVATKEQIEELDAWWAENRSRSKIRLSDEVAKAFSALAEMPNRGTLYKRLRNYDVRQFRLQGTPYSLFYVVNQEADEVVVVAAWSGQVGAGPPLDESF
jgi:plasmid stabilization system protein ParE